MQNIPRLVRFAAAATASSLIVLSLLRAAFFAAFDNGADPVPAADLRQAFYIGLKFDLRVTLLLLLPLLTLAWLPPLDPFARRAARGFWIAYLALAAFAVGLFYVVDFGHYAYLAAHMDNTALRFLHDAAISATMVWESYPVIAIALGLAAFTAAAAGGAHLLFVRLAALPAVGRRWPRRLLIGTATAFLLLLGLYGKLSWYPLRWSDAFFSTHPFAAAVAVNPVHYFVDALRNGGVRYDEAKVRAHYEAMAAYLGVEAPDPKGLRFERAVTGVARRERPPNVVMVQLESFAAYKSSLSGNPLDPTPRLAALAREGIHFPNFFVPHTGTARAVFATLTGIPDVETNGTSSRNPVIVSQRTLIEEFEGYEKFYFLGGSASWGNIRGLLSHNIPGLKIYEEGSYESPRVDVWGISDLSLFEEANRVLRDSKAPFFAYIQTSGGHRPYTIPVDRRGFEIARPGEGEVLRHGFISEAEFNSFRFLDHAVGWFIDNARREEYFADTLFVFFGDHGLGGDAGRHVAAGETQLDLGSYRVPLVIYAPGLVEPRRETKVASQIDLLPTVAALAGRPYRQRTLGRDLLDPRFDGSRYAFTVDHGRRTIGLVGAEGFVFRIGMDGKGARLYRSGGAAPRDDLSATEPERTREMKDLTLAIYETSKYLLHHNGR